MARLVLSMFAGLGVFLFVQHPSYAQAPQKTAPKPAAEAAIGAPDPTTSSFEERETAALAFVKAHHPELGSLLELLKAMKQSEYEQAIGEINRVQRRLESQAKRDPELYTIDLEAWKLQSKVDLLLARAVAQDKPPVADELRKLLRRQLEVQRKRLRHERNSLAERQKQIKESLDKLEAAEEDRVEQQVAALTKKVKAKVDTAMKSRPRPAPSLDDQKKSGATER
jgi:hypothetical protein